MTEPVRIIADYVRRLRWSLQAIPAEDRNGLVREIESHLTDSLAVSSESLDATIRAMGSPHTLAARYVQEFRLAGALGDDRPAPLIHALLIRPGRSMAAFGGVLAAMLLYLFALFLAAMAIAKPLFPSHVGLWSQSQGSAFGIMTDPPAGPEMLGLWVLPVALAGALACYALATLVLRGTGRHVLRAAR
ncbi:HAAS signaling domain-containing protein [uncultured Sphingomonas sp.]|uniref:HAAS signaling domain-containing protein n=1 Tax=uncultured Sphingomonas sp. TaxID=158754 RepID=UPI0037497C18